MDSEWARNWLGVPELAICAGIGIFVAVGIELIFSRLKHWHKDSPSEVDRAAPEDQPSDD
jgi:hypothetical protein